MQMVSATVTVTIHHVCEKETDSTLGVTFDKFK